MFKWTSVGILTPDKDPSLVCGVRDSVLFFSAPETRTGLFFSQVLWEHRRWAEEKPLGEGYGGETGKFQ